MKIFRVEDKTGDGPYAEDGPLRQFIHDKESPVRRTDRHPSPFGEGDDPRNGLLMMGFFGEFVYGFISKQQALDWFYKPEWREAMSKAGYHLTEWEVSNNPRVFINGYKQVMFIRDKAKLLSSNVPWDEANSPAIESTIDKPKRKRAKVKSLVQEEQATN
jgi:hypothetical protein